MQHTMGPLAAGPDHVDVPGHSKRPCRLTFLALTEGAAAATITLRNEATREYMFWQISVSAAAAPIKHAQPWHFCLGWCYLEC